MAMTNLPAANERIGQLEGELKARDQQLADLQAENATLR